MLKNANSKIKELESDIKGYNRDIKRDPDDASLYDLKADALTELGKLKNDSAYYQQALECRNKAIELEPENASYLTVRSKLHVLMERPDLAAKDITEAQKSSDTGNKLLNMYNANTTKDILKLDGVQKEITRMIDNGELPPAVSAVFSDMIQVITGISTRVSEHDERLNLHDERFEKDEEELRHVQEKLTALESQHPNLIQLIEGLRGEITSLQGRLGVQEEKAKAHDEAILRLSSQAIKGLSDLHQKIDKMPNYSVMKKELDEVGQAINGLLADKRVSEQTLEEVIKGIQDIKDENDLTSERFSTMRQKIRAIEGTLKAQEKSVVAMFTEAIYDNPILNHPELLTKASGVFGINQAIKLGNVLCPKLIQEAASNNDITLLLAGALSMEYE